MKKDIAFGGVSRVPGGAVSSDGDLCAAVDVCNDGMGLEMLEKPEELFTLQNGEDTNTHLEYTEELLCIHEPEGEGKHYITQLFIESTVEPVATRGGTRSTAPYDIIDDPTEGGGHGGYSGGGAGGSGGYSGGGGSSGYTPPSSGSSTGDIWSGTDVASAYSTIISSENTYHSGDYGVEVDENHPYTAGHIYLRYYALNETRDTATYSVRQAIDITPFGKVTAIEPMGNTLICNHEGSDAYPPEIRYYLWKKLYETEDDVTTEIKKYVALGSKPPMVNITFGLESTFEYYPKKRSVFKSSGGSESTVHLVYKTYGGIFMETRPYLDTVPYYWETSWDSAQIPPYIEAIESGNMSHWTEAFSLDGVVSPDGKTDVAGIKANWTTATLGSYNKFIAEQHKENKFVFPFYVRYAYELYDGSLTMHSYPILMIPNSRGPIFALDGKAGIEAKGIHVDDTYAATDIVFRGRTYGFSSTLMHEIAQMAANDLAVLKNWKDLIRGLNIYVTPPIYNYNQGGQVLGWHCMSSDAPGNNDENPWKKFYTVGRVKYTDRSSNDAVPAHEDGAVTLDFGFTDILPKESNSYTVQGLTYRDNIEIFWPWDTNTAVTPNVSYPTPDYCLTIPQKDEKVVTELHENAGQFYKLASIEYEKLLDMVENGVSESPLEMGKKIVNTIANQDIMKDDNGTHDTMSAEVLYGYNRRLNMAQVQKMMHTPLLPKVQWAKEYYEVTSNNVTSYENNLWQVNIYAKNGGRQAVVKVTANDVNTRWPLFVFYPNTNATEAVLIHGLERYKVRLREHKALNGMFWLGDFYNKYDDLRNYQLVRPVTDSQGNSLSVSSQADTILTKSNVNRNVSERNKIYTSETDNPFVVPFGNINIAGGGDVRALAAATQAMSQGQFGQHPMYTFTSEGVWAMSVNDTGGWATIQPVTRDVIVEGTKPLSLDSTVVFLSERGLLNLAGSDVKVLSNVLQGADPLLLEVPDFGLNKLTDLCRETGTGNAAGDGGLIAVAKFLADGKFPESAWMTYDYDNARIYVTPKNGAGSWVFNLKSQLWTQASMALDNQIVSYPECEGQSGGKVIRISVDRAMLNNLRTEGLVISRPIKLADMGLLKRWREMVVRGRFRPYSNVVKCALWGTRDWINHALVASSTSNRLTRRSGSPYFGHSVALFLTAPTAADAETPAWVNALQVSGMDCEIDTEHDNKLR